VVVCAQKYFEWKSFLSIMAILTKHANDVEILSAYIFDIFSKYKPIILKEQLQQVFQIFIDAASNSKLKEDFARCETLTKPEFQKLCRNIDIDFRHFSKISTLFEVELGMTNLSYEKELEVIRIALDGETDLKEYFSAKLAVASSDDTFYILAKSFWQRWSSYVGLPRVDTFGVSFEK